MINLKNYIQILIADFVLKHIKITDDTVYVNPGIYAKLREKIGESTIDSLIHEITGKEYAGYIGITIDYRYKWHEETHTYSQRYFQEDGSFLIGAG